MNDSYDVIVIGSGPAGYPAAIRAAQNKLKVACVDEWKNTDGSFAFGGTCLNAGCIPSKALLESSELYQRAKDEFAVHGIKIGGLALDLAAIDGVLSEVRRAGILVQVGFQRRFDAGYRAAHDAVAAGALRTLLVVRATTHDPTPPAEEYIASSGGIFRDLHIHDFDAIRYVTGCEIVEVYADGAVLETPWFGDHGDVDTAVAVVRLSGGALGILSGTRHDPLGYDVRLEVFGTGDSIVAAGADGRSPLRSVEPGTEQARGAGYANFMERFVPRSEKKNLAEAV